MILKIYIEIRGIQGIELNILKIILKHELLLKLIKLYSLRKIKVII